MFLSCRSAQCGHCSGTECPSSPFSMDSPPRCVECFRVIVFMFLRADKALQQCPYLHPRPSSVHPHHRFLSPSQRGNMIHQECAPGSGPEEVFVMRSSLDVLDLLLTNLIGIISRRRFLFLSLK